MTNGEIIQSMFPSMNFGTLAQDDVIVNKDYSNNDEPQVFIPQRVWDAEYKEPTTKNDLGVDCISRKAVLDITWQDPSYADPLNVLTEVRDKVRELPSVTPQEPIKAVLRDIQAKIQKYREQCENETWSYYIEGKKEAYTDVLVLIDKHTSGKEEI